MAWSFFMNMEKLTLQIAEKHISCMNNENYDKHPFGEGLDNCDLKILKMDNFINNIENGFVVITQLSCFFESFLNTIINSCMKYEGDILLKCSIDEKMDFIFMYYNKNLSVIKSNNSWSIYKKTAKVRNEMIHFKKTYISSGHFLENFTIGKQEVGNFFTKDNMTYIFNQHIALSELIASSLELKIFKNIDIFEMDGRDGLVNYVYSNDIYIDESRLES